MTNPFEDAEDAAFLVLRNDEGQYSLWPGFVEAPSGWAVVLEQAGKQACLDYVNSHWSDMRPNSLRAVMGADREQ